jgi:hypothetical protein
VGRSALASDRGTRHRYTLVNGPADVVRSPNEPVRIILKEAQTEVAPSAKDPSHLAGSVVVVDVQPPSGLIQKGTSADRALAALALEYQETRTAGDAVHPGPLVNSLA